MKIDEYLGHISAAYLIVVCEVTYKSCPRIFPGMLERLMWPFDDPAAFVRTRDHSLTEFRRVLDQIRNKLEQWLVSL